MTYSAPRTEHENAREAAQIFASTHTDSPATKADLAELRASVLDTLNKHLWYTVTAMVALTGIFAAIVKLCSAPPRTLDALREWLSRHRHELPPPQYFEWMLDQLAAEQKRADRLDREQAECPICGEHIEDREEA